MAEINTVIAEASQDLQTIEDFVNLPADSEVYPRLLPSVNVGTLAGAREAIFKAGGLPATPFTTKALMTASSLANDSYAYVTNDTAANNGLYIKQSGAWSITKGSPSVVVGDFLNQELGARVIALNPVNINYVTTTKTLEFTSTVYFYSRDRRQLLITPASVSFSSNGVYRLEVNRQTRAIRSNQIFATNDVDWLVFAFVTIRDGMLYTSDIDGFAIDGKQIGSMDGYVKASELRDSNYSLALMDSDTLDFRFNEDKIVLNKSIYIPYGTSRLLIPAQTITLAPDRVKSGAYRDLIFVNPINSQLVFANTGGGVLIPSNHIFIGAYREFDNMFWGFEHFMVNGVPFNTSGGGGSPAPSGDVANVPVFGWSADNPVDLSVTDSYKPSDPVPMTSMSSSIVYGWFDALRDAHPDYITKTQLGMDASGTIPIYQYRFKPKQPLMSEVTLKYKTPKVFLMTQHNEQMNFIYLYTLMREICNSWVGSDSLTSMRHGVEFVVVPVGNPWGLDNRSRTNSNQVDLNRNFPVKWMKIGVAGDVSYSGESALSESETQAIWASMQTEKPNVFFDCHSFGPYKVDGEALWFPVVNQASLNSIVAAINKIYAQHKKKHSWLTDVDKLARVTDSRFINSGGLASKSADSLGCIGGTFETAWSLKDDPDTATGNSNIVNLASNMLGTLILQSIKTLIKTS